MKRSAVVVLEKTTKNAHKLVEQTQAGQPPILQQGVYLPTWMFKGTPQQVKITIEGDEVLA